MHDHEPSELTPKSLGEIIDGLELKMNMREGDLMSDVIVLAKVIEADGKVRMSSAASPSTDWITRLGLATTAYEIERPSQSEGCHHE